MDEQKWIDVKRCPPKRGVVVETKIDDDKGTRNETQLVRGGENGRIWFYPDFSMYVYYEPTHWRPPPPSSQEPNDAK